MKRVHDPATHGNKMRTVFGFLLLLSLGISNCGDRALGSKDIEPLEAVYQFVTYGDSGLSQVQRQEVAEGRLVRKIDGWPFQDKLRIHRLYAFPAGWNYDKGGTLVVVDNQLRVWPINEAKDFNELLSKEGLLLHTEKDAIEAARLFLKCYRVANVMDYEWELGINVIGGPDDIEFKDESERNAVIERFDIAPPSVIRDDDGSYHYVLYSWKNFGNGSLDKHELVITEKEILEYKIVPLANNVGKWTGLR